MEIINSQIEPQPDNVFRVTDIKQGVKNPNRVNIFIDGKYSFSLDIAQLVDFKLKIGQEITEAELAEYQQASAFGKLYQRALEWVLTRPRSVKETRDYLSRKLKENQKILYGGIRSHDEGSVRSPVTTGATNVPEKYLFDSAISDILTILIDKQYLDDRIFAKYYVENRFTKKGISKKRLKMELIKKGVSNTIIEEILSDSSRTDEEEIKKIIAKKRNKYDDIKLIQYLVRQGFDFELARNLVSNCETD